VKVYFTVRSWPTAKVVWRRDRALSSNPRLVAVTLGGVPSLSLYPTKPRPEEYFDICASTLLYYHTGQPRDLQLALQTQLHSSEILVWKWLTAALQVKAVPHRNKQRCPTLPSRCVCARPFVTQFQPLSQPITDAGEPPLSIDSQMSSPCQIARPLETTLCLPRR
jgi:hypothetical protein